MEAAALHGSMPAQHERARGVASASVAGDIPEEQAESAHRMRRFIHIAMLGHHVPTFFFSVPLRGAWQLELLQC